MIPYVKIVIVLTLAVCLISGAYASTITTSAKGDSVITSDSLLNVQTDESNVDTIAHASSSLLNGEVEYAKSLNTVTGETESAYVAKKTSLIYDAQMTTNINKEKSNLCSMSSTGKAPKVTVKSSTQTSNLIGDNIDMYTSGKPSTSYSVELSEIKKSTKQVLLVVIPLLAYFLLWIAKSAPLDALHSGGDVFGQWRDGFVANAPVFGKYLPFVALCWVLFQFGKGLAARTLMIFSLTVVALLAVAIAVGGPVAMWCVVAIGLFTSVGWSNTFSLALEGTGIYKSQVSSLLVMAILGGAILPPLQGWIADHTNIQLSFIVPLIAYAYVAFYGAMGHRIGRPKQKA